MPDSASYLSRTTAGMRRVLFIAALLAAGSASALGQPGYPFSPNPADAYADTYIDDQMERYKQVRAEVLDDFRMIYFALGCRVLPEAYAEPLVSDEAAYLEAEAFSIHFLDVEGADLRDDAEHEGLAAASSAGACDYWGQHPEAVLALLWAARDAMGQPQD